VYSPPARSNGIGAIAHVLGKRLSAYSILVANMILLVAACGGPPLPRMTPVRNGAEPIAEKDDQGVHGARRLPTTSPTPAPPGSIFCPTFSTAASASAHSFLTCHYQGPGKEQMTFYVYVPNGYDPTQAYPVVLILHGVAEAASPTASAEANRINLVGQDYVSIWGPGYPAGGPSVQSRWPCFVIVPQLVGSNRWVNVPPGVSSYQLTSQPSVSLQMAIDITRLMEQRYASIDTDRVYITGISMGAYGVWDAVLRWPQLFAAAVPVSGAGDPALASRIANLPIWDFHGGDDNLVPVTGSQAMVHALRADGGHPCYTQFPGALHVIWDQVYGIQGDTNNPLYPWLFAEQKDNETGNVHSC
jgi:predicted peptidase